MVLRDRAVFPPGCPPRGSPVCGFSLVCCALTSGYLSGMQAVPIMFDRVTTRADELRDLFGERALNEAEARFSDATLWRDRQAAILYADVCSELRQDEVKRTTWKPRSLKLNWLTSIFGQPSGRVRPKHYSLA
jgi:hypothetical protein